MKRSIIKRIVPVLMMLAVTATAMAQSDPMPGFRNPSSFSCSGSGGTFRGWSARVGERVSSGASTGSVIYSTCAATNCPDITGHSNITSSTYNTGPDAGISCCNHGSLWDAAQDKRFMIIPSTNAGIDELTIGTTNEGIQRIPPGYQSSIRLGDPRASYETSPTSFTWTASNSSHTNRGAEALFYTMDVTPQNALLFINYAVVGRCYSHEPAQAGEFIIRVVAQNDDGTWPNAPINDSMWFRISAPPIPSSGVPNLPWMMGRPGSSCGSTTCAYVYKPWAKVAISLTKYLYSKVRVELYTNDCIYNVDPIYAYVCGDYQPMVLTSSGCPDAESDVVDTLAAPQGMLTYAWYVATRGAVSDLNVQNTDYMDTVSFRQVWPPAGGTDTSNIYAAHIEDFVVSEGPNVGDTVDKQTFMCVMTSALDPSKPFESRIYANVSNRKPLIGYGYEAHCDTSITFVNGSIIYVAEGQQDDSTHWVFYADTLGQVPLDTVYGNTVTYQFPNEGYYGVKLFVTTEGDPCTAAELFTVRAFGTPPADFTLNKHRLCESDVLTMQAAENVRQRPELTLTWAVDDSTLATGVEAHTTLPVGPHIISLTATTPDGCTYTLTDSVTVFGQPTIDLSSEVSAICLGDSVTLSAAGSVDYTWNSAPYDPTLDAVQGQTTFTVHPTVNTTYYLLPSTDNPCSIEGAEVYIEVIPYPTPTVYCSSPRVNIESSTVSFQDVSPYTASSHWHFSDGASADGPRVVHSFGDLSGDSVTISLHTCNRLQCCSDTSFSLPVEVTTVWFPNAFTPDDTENNRFGIHTGLTLTSYEIYIYDRNGRLVHTSTDPADQWDGTTDSGKALPQGAYVWFCRYTYHPGAFYTLDGTVTLIR